MATLDFQQETKKLLPNYTKNPELELEKTLLELKGGRNPDQFKKDLDVTNAKIQPIPLEGNKPTIPKEHLENHLKDLSNPNKMQCKFLSSPKCHKDYPNFSGASIQFPEGAKMKCDALSNSKPAKAICTINNGAINGVYVINGGEGLEENAIVEPIGGGGTDAKLKAKVVDGKLVDIEIIHGGTGYYESPTIKIQEPNLSNGCFLCCK